jgi:LytS/YehU family sensor histidine kinase
MIKFAILWFIIVQLFSVIYFALYSYYSYSTLQIQRIKLERKQIDLQLNALKSQLSPHFLFNAFNTISSLIYKDVNKAETFIRRLSEMYHYTLESYQTKLILFEEELEFVKSYIYLQETRFERVFECKIDLPASINNTKIPPLALQMLIENAVKHNLMSERNPLKVNVSFEDDHICVENNITEEPRKVPSFKIGLNNINARYQLLSNKEIIIANGQSFIVKIPVIR